MIYTMFNKAVILFGSLWSLLFLDAALCHELTPKIWLLILRSGCYTFLVKWLQDLGFDQDNILYLISLSILTTCLLDNVWIL